jgi:hypothetical protein
LADKQDFTIINFTSKNQQNRGQMRIIPILSSVIVVIGCFMPWIQLGALFTNRGIDNPDGAIMLIAGVIAGSLAFYNYSQDKPKNTWIYSVVGVIGIIIAFIDLNEVTSRAQKIAEGLGQFNSFFGGSSNISLMNFIGSGLYIVCCGSIGLVLCGIGVFKAEATLQTSVQTLQTKKEPEEISLTKKCPACAEIIKKEAKICRFCQYKFSEEELIEDAADIEVELKEETVHKELSELRQMIITEKGKWFGGGMTDEIQILMDNLFTSKDEAIRLLNTYKTIFQTDLIDELKELNSSYDAIKRNVSTFIDLDIIEENFPHAPKK